MTRPPVPLEDPIAQAYIEWCTSDQRESPHTIRRRRCVLRSLGNPSTATRDQVERWWTTRNDHATASRINALAVLRHFYRWCQTWEHRLDDPTIRITPPRRPPGKPRPISEADLRRLLEHLAEQPELRRAVYLGAYAGLRVSEAAGLHWRDVDVTSHTARILGKGRKVRHVRLAPKLLEALLPDTGGYVVTGDDRRWSPDWLGRQVNAAITEAGVAATFHKLRHRYGSIAYQRTLDPKALADQLGHASVATTMTFYAAAADEAAQAIADSVFDEDDD